MALSWVLRDQRVSSALMGASSPAQIRENVKAVSQTSFTDEELGKIDRILDKIQLPDSLWAGE
jgi:L-glyceraldehyde 3-phosphate reductase